MTDTYKIAVEIALAGNLSQALTGIAGRLSGLHGKVGQIEKAMGGWGDALVAVGGILAAGAIVQGIDSIIDSTRELSHELVQIQKLGISTEQLSGLRAAAINVTRNVPGTTETSALSMFGQTYSMLGYSEAIKALPELARFAQVLGNTTGDYDSANKSVYQMIRSADLIGRLSDPITKQLDPERLEHFLDVATRVAQATHGQIGPQQWLALAQQGGPALRGLNDAGLIGQAIIGQAMGASRAGTASMSMFQQFAGGTMFTRNAEALQDLGLLQPGDWHTDHGRVILDDSTSKRLMESLRADPLKFMTDTLLPLMQQRGITSPDEQIREIFRIFGRQTTQRMTADEISNIKQMLSERERISAALGTPQAFDVQNAHDIEQALQNLTASFTNLKTALGGPESENITRGINRLTSVIDFLSEATRKLNLGKIWVDQLPGIGDPLLLLDDLGHALQNLTHLPYSQAIDGLRNIEQEIAGFISHIWHGIGGGTRHLDMLGNPEGAHNQSFVAPAGSSKPIVIQSQLNVDGDALARSVTNHLADQHEMPQGAASPNGGPNFMSPDYNIPP